MTIMKPGTIVGQLPPTELQETNERRFSRKHINGYLDTAIRQNPQNEEKVHQGILLLNEWIAYWQSPWKDQCKTENYYNIKNARLAQLASLEREQLVRDIFIGIAYCQVPELFVSVTAQLASKLGFSDKRDSIQTIAEIVAVLCDTDAFDIIKASADASLMIQSNLVMPRALEEAVARSLYLPPMVSQPHRVKTNFESPYLTHNDCLILGRGNAHTDDICLDAINTQNNVALQLSTEFLSTVEEEPNYPLDTLEKKQQWDTFKKNSYALYEMLVKQGNKFWLTNKVDKRGRLYAQGYHVTSQGSAFKKAMLELANEEIVNGVPTA